MAAVKSLFAKVWQLPNVDVFKQAEVWKGKNAKLQGDVSIVKDPVLHKPVMRIAGGRGLNLLQLPHDGAPPLGLTGTYVYAQLKGCGAGRYFAIHLDVLNNAGLTVRLSFSNSFKAVKVADRSIQFPADFINSAAPDAAAGATPNASVLTDIGADQRWCVLALHIPSLVASYMPSFHVTSLKAMTFHADLFVRNVMTSSIRYDAQSLPRAITFPLKPGTDFDDAYDWFWLRAPQQLVDKNVPVHLREHDNTLVLPGAAGAASAAGGPGAAADAKSKASAAGDATARSTLSMGGASSTASPSRIASARGDAAAIDEKENMRPANGGNGLAAAAAAAGVKPLDLKRLAPSSPGRRAAAGGAAGAEPRVAVDARIVHAAADATKPVNNAQLINAAAAAAQAAGQNVRLKGDGAYASVGVASTLSPDPIMQLNKAIGYTPHVGTRNLCWMPQDSKTALYSSNNLILMHDMETGDQRFLLGHTAPVSVLTLSRDGALLASAQEGKQPMIRIWDTATRRCIAYLLGLDRDVRSLTFSVDKRYLAALGKDSTGRCTIVVWKILGVQEGGGAGAAKCTIAAKQVSEYSVAKLLFSPFEDDAHTLVSCGHENVRFWRIKNKHLPGASVMLGQYVRGNSFTDVAFELNYGAADVGKKRMYVSSSSGSVFQINYPDRLLECIYKLHSGAINCLSVSEGFCVTGSADAMLRVWPLDFSEFYLQAQHKGAICSVDISANGTKVLIGAGNGQIGVLDMTTRAYQVKVRAHTAPIHGLAFDPHRDEFATVSSDGTIRVWGAHSMEQLYEFVSPAGEQVTSVVYHPKASQYRLAVGFDTGFVRVIDIASTTMLHEYKQHASKVVELVFSADGLYLYSCDEECNLCAYDVLGSYAPLRMFASGRAKRPVTAPHFQQPTQLQQLQASGAVPSLGAGATTKPSVSAGAAAAKPAAAAAKKDVKSADNATKKSAWHPYYALAINPTGNLLATIGVDATTAIVVDTVTMREKYRVSTGGPALGSEPIAKLVFAPDNTELCLVLRDCSFQRYNLATQQLVNHTRALAAVRRRNPMDAAAGNNQFALTPATGGGPGGVGGSPVCVGVGTSPHGRFVLTANDRAMIRVWDYFSSTPALGVQQTPSQDFTSHFNTPAARTQPQGTSVYTTVAATAAAASAAAASLAAASGKEAAKEAAHAAASAVQGAAADAKANTTGSSWSWNPYGVSLSFDPSCTQLASAGGESIFLWKFKGHDVPPAQPKPAAAASPKKARVAGGDDDDDDDDESDGDTSRGGADSKSIASAVSSKLPAIPSGPEDDFDVLARARATKDRDDKARAESAAAQAKAQAAAEAARAAAALAAAAATPANRLALTRVDAKWAETRAELDRLRATGAAASGSAGGAAAEVKHETLNLVSGAALEAAAAVAVPSDAATVIAAPKAHNTTLVAAGDAKHAQLSPRPPATVPLSSAASGPAAGVVEAAPAPLPAAPQPTQLPQSVFAQFRQPRTPFGVCAPPPYSVSKAAPFLSVRHEHASFAHHKVLGFNGGGRSNVVWVASLGLMAYASGNHVVVQRVVADSDLNIEDVDAAALQSEQRVLFGHTEEVSTLAVSRNGRFLASGTASTKCWSGATPAAADAKGGIPETDAESRMGCVRVWDTATWTCVGYFALDTFSSAGAVCDGVQSLEFDMTATTLVVATAPVSTAAPVVVASTPVSARPPAQPSASSASSSGSFVGVYDLRLGSCSAFATAPSPIYALKWLPGRSAAPGAHNAKAGHLYNAQGICMACGDKQPPHAQLVADPSRAVCHAHYGLSGSALCHFVSAGAQLACWTLCAPDVGVRAAPEAVAAAAAAVCADSVKTRYTLQAKLFKTELSVAGHFTCVDFVADDGKLGAGRQMVTGTSKGDLFAWGSDGRVLTTWKTTAAVAANAKADDGDDGSEQIGWVSCGAAVIDHAAGTSSGSITVGGTSSLVQRYTYHKAGSDGKTWAVTRDGGMAVDGPVVGASFHPSVAVGLVGTASGTVWMCDFAQPYPVRLCNSHQAFVNAVAFHNSGRVLVSASSDGSLRVWGVHPTSSAHTHQVVHFQVKQQHALCVSVHPHELSVVVGYSDGVIRFFDVANMQVSGKAQPQPDAVTALAHIDSGRSVVCGTVDGQVLFLDSATRTYSHSLPSQEHRDARIDCVSVSPHNPAHWLVTDYMGRMSVWESEWSSSASGSAAAAGAVAAGPSFGTHTLLRWVDLNTQYTLPYQSSESHPDYAPPTLAVFAARHPALIVCSAPAAVSPNAVVYDDERAWLPGVRPPPPSQGPAVWFYDYLKHQFIGFVMTCSPITSLDVSPDGLYLAIGQQSRLVTLFDLRNTYVSQHPDPNARAENVRPRKVTDVLAHADLVNAVKFAPAVASNTSPLLATASFAQLRTYRVSADASHHESPHKRPPRDGGAPGARAAAALQQVLPDGAAHGGAAAQL